VGKIVAVEKAKIGSIDINFYKVFKVLEGLFGLFRCFVYWYSEICLAGGILKTFLLEMKEN